MTAQVNEQVFK